MTSALAAARALAEEVLLPRADEVDRGAADPGVGLDALAEAGLYGLHAPRWAGGLEADGDTAGRVVEALAGGCLTTAFVWIQHQGVVKRLVRAGGPVAATWLPRLAAGRVRSGVAVGGIRSASDPLVATRDGTDWVLEGTVPWVTGFGFVDVVLVAAREDGDGPVVWLLADAPRPDPAAAELTTDDPTFDLRRIHVVACDASVSAAVTLAAHRVPGDRLLHRQPVEQWRSADAAGLRTNGSLSLGLATRCAILAEAPWLHERVDRVRAELDAADVDGLPTARAAAGELVWDAVGVLLVTTGGRGIARGATAQRLAREAMFLQVFGSRPAIRDAHLARLRRGG